MSTDTTPTTRQAEHDHQMTPQANSKMRGVVALFSLALTVLAVCATPASADYGQVVQHFGTSGEAEQLERDTALAINTTGAGGVEPGSLYVVGINSRVVRYGPGREGEEPPFKEAWGWGIGDGKEEYERCGPALATEPAQHTYHTCIPPKETGQGSAGGEQAGNFGSLGSVAVDTATGDVYVRNVAKPGIRVHHLIEMFTATGVPVGEGFGEQGRESPSPAESIAEGPDKLHEAGPAAAYFEDIAVDEAGTVYVTDIDFNHIADPPGEVRVMSFVPEHPGDYEHYVYTGESKDISASRSSVGTFARLALVGSNRLVAANEKSIFEYALGGGNALVCSNVVHGQLFAMTANSVTGEVFYATGADEKIHRLSACDPNSGHFTEAQAPLAVTPTTGGIVALAVNPGLSWGPLRPEGVLYAADSEEHRQLTPVEHGIGDIFAPAKVLLPSVVDESVAGTTVDSTVLRAEVSPNGFTIGYGFQYVRGTVYVARKAQAEGEGKTAEEAVEAAFAGATEVPVGGGTLASGGVGAAEAGVAGLEPETEYRFRVLVSSECEGSSRPACATTGEVASFSTYPAVSQGLADGRVYELVSPPEKDGGEAFPADPGVGSCSKECKPPGGATFARFPMQSAPDGNSVVYMGDPFSANEGVVSNEYVSKRTANGWQTSDLSPALQNIQSSGSVIFDTGLGKDLIYQVSPQLTANAPSGYANLYLQDTSAPDGLEPLMVSPPPDRSPTSFKLEFAGASQDLSRAFFSANDALTEETPFAPEPADPGTFGHDLYEWREGSLALVNVAPGDTSVVEGAVFASATGPSGLNPAGTLSPDEHAVSSDGSRVFWSAAGHVYVRVDGEETVEVATGNFLTASADGLEVLFTDGRLYRYDEETGAYEQASDLTEGQGGFQGILGTGEENGELSHVYFVDTQVLAGSGENERGQTAKSGEDNLYLWEGGAPHYIAALVSDYNEYKDWSFSPVTRTAESSSEGRWLAFVSKVRLTGYDNTSDVQTCPNGGVPTHCSEVFLYDSVTGRLSCVSCDPTGEAPRGPSTLRVIAGAYEWFPQPRYLTDSGRLVFDSGDRLSAADSNGRVEDVYEFEPDAVGSCKRLAGCVVLISPGTGSLDSNFLAMDENGANVFFTTRERLVPQDHDELIDVYDAREHGGFASQTETQRAECQGEACQSMPLSPVFTTPGSSTFAGAGNLVQALPTAPASKTKTVTTGKKSRSKALRKCRLQRSKRKRVACERQARKTAQRANNARHGKKGGAR